MPSDARVEHSALDAYLNYFQVDFSSVAGRRDTSACSVVVNRKLIISAEKKHTPCPFK